VAFVREGRRKKEREEERGRKELPFILQTIVSFDAAGLGRER